MTKILIAVDGSKDALNAVKSTIAHAALFRDRPTLELIFVHPSLPYLGRVTNVMGKDAVQQYYDEEGAAALESAKRALDAADLKYKPQILVGPVAETIVQHAKETACTLIVMGTRGMGAAGNLLLGSVVAKVLHLSDRPVLVVK